MNTRLFISTIAAVALACACEQERIGSIPMDSVAPGEVTDVQVTNVPGGADISYKIPSDEDLLMVKAYYNLESGKVGNVTVSMYVDTIKIRGYARPKPHTVRIVAVDRSGNESKPVDVRIEPLRSPIFDVLNTLSLGAAFGGVTLNWDNPTRAALAVTLMKKTGEEWEELNTYYSESAKGHQTNRGLQSETTEFGAFVKDRWDNVTDTMTVSLTPLFEEQLPVGSYKKYEMTGDCAIAYGWDLGYALNGNLDEPWGWFSKPTVDGGTWPARFTVKVDGGVTLSRVRIIQRWPEMWENGNPKKFTVWGSNNPASDGSYDGWEEMKTFVSVKPSGLPVGQYSDEDEYIAVNGEDFEFDPENLARFTYYRFQFTENWGGDNTWINLYEVFFYGNFND